MMTRGSFGGQAGGGMWKFGEGKIWLASARAASPVPSRPQIFEPPAGRAPPPHEFAIFACRPRCRLQRHSLPCGPPAHVQLPFGPRAVLKSFRSPERRAPLVCVFGKRKKKQLLRPCLVLKYFMHVSKDSM
jgi:hypothetical protein